MSTAVADRAVPASVEAEASVLGAMILSTDACRAVVPILSSADFYRPAHAAVFAAVTSLYARGGAVDAVTVVDELRAHGTLDIAGGAREVVSLATTTPATSSAAHYARVIAAHKARRQLIAVAGEIATVGYDLGVDPSEATDRARLLIDTVDVVADGIAARSITADDLADSGDDPYDWVIPGFIDREDRAIFVAPEGHGKTTLLRQIAVTSAQGMCPFTSRPRRPVRAHVFDLENPRRIFRRSMAALVSTAHTRSRAYDPDRLWTFHQPAGIDIRTRQGFAEVERELTASRPDLVCIGPLYKLFVKRPGETDEDAAADVQRRLDDLRSRFAFALLLEHHAPKGQSTVFREMIPFGSALWLRWPEFGIALQSEKKDDRSTLEWGHWRGPRDVRPWPNRITRGQVWPWEPAWDKTMPTEHALDMPDEESM